MKQFPKARTKQLTVQGFKDELLIYDWERDEAHCLNRTAALVWKHCDGHTSVAQITSRLGEEIEDNAVADERLVWYALKQFERDHLLESKLDLPAGMLASINVGLNRRQLIRTLGLTAMVTLPLVTSIVAPTPAQAASCIAAGQPCATSAQCCNGICTGAPNGTCN